ncbi:MAG: hypothetical protein ACK5WQ_07490 [Alphaproteobacteria bacterium]
MSKKRPEWLDEILKPENLSAAKPAVLMADFLSKSWFTCRLNQIQSTQNSLSL